MTAIWTFKTLGQLIPVLDPGDPDSLVSKGNAELDKLQGSITAFNTGVSRFAAEVNKLALSVNSLIDAVQDLSIATMNTAVAVLVITSPGLPVGKSQYTAAITAALNEPNAPPIGNSTFVASLSLLITGPSAAEVIQRYNTVAKVLKGIEGFI